MFPRVDNRFSLISKYVLLVRYNSESLQIKVVVSGNGLLFQDIKISLGLLITVRKSLPRGVKNCKQSNQSLCCRTQNSKQILVLSDPIK